MVLAAASFGQSVTYDRFKDESRGFVEVKVKDNGKPRNKLDNLQMLTLFTFPGAKLSRDVNVFAVAFSASGQSWRFLRSHELRMIVDGKRYDLGPGDHDGKIIRTGVYESVTFMFDRKTFEAVATATAVELQLGRYEGFIDADNLAKLKALLALSTFPKSPE